MRDAELTAPLPPIDQFQVTPVKIAGDDADDDDVEVAYTTKLEGLDKADKDTGADLASEFKGLSALHKGKGKAANIAMVSARLTEDSQLMETVLASQGWYSPLIKTRIDRSEAPDGQPLSAVIAVNPGKRYVLSDIVVQAAPTVPVDLIRSNLALKVGEPIVADRVQGGRGARGGGAARKRLCLRQGRRSRYPARSGYRRWRLYAAGRGRPARQVRRFRDRRAAGVRGRSHRGAGPFQARRTLR
ncbi:hypothetical protein ACFSTD_08595 [Novosphingobium colocasiae]